ncbi:glyceraldehyde-3-phosphate dehydrogenase [Chitinibacter sp. S2-10]|uniref:glyceraldehyde-3-phosphate dehydrogenase n=1 Tax=Chitinibacter sp. S2-10 TaxID=3373597 RepID=UPI0039775A54
MKSLRLMALLLVLLGPTSQAESLFDSEDGNLDLSHYLLNQKGFLPVPILITEPALDYGGGIGALWFNESFAEKQASEGQFAVPTMGGLFGFKTGNGSWGAGGGYFIPLDHDRYRYLGGAGKFNLNLDYYSLSGQQNAYAFEGVGLIQQLLARIGDSNWFIGPRYVYARTEAQFASNRPAEIIPNNLDIQIGQLSLLIDYDSRNNLLTPSAGSFIEAELGAVREALGANVEYNSFNLRGYHYQALGKQWILGLRADQRIVGNDAPFFALPYITLRGIPALRYQDSKTSVLETELRWNLNSRWALVGFVGAGKAYGKRDSWDDSELVVAGGGGFRYLIASKLGLYVGADVARGPEESAVYIQVGSAWR